MTEKISDLKVIITNQTLNRTCTSMTYNLTEESQQALVLPTNKSQLQDVIFWATIDGFLFLAIVTGNVLTITAIIMTRRISSVVSNQFILSLAISDLLVGLVLPYHMMFYIKPELGFIREFCLARLALVSLACIASVLNIIGIAIDRFIAIIYPLHYNKFMTKRLARSFLVICWVLAIVVSTAPVYWNKWDAPAINKCELGYVVDKFYVIIIYVPTFILLFTIMSGFYVKIIREARKHAIRLRKSNQFKNDPPDTWKSTQVLMLVMGSFTISYTPFIIIVILTSVFQINHEGISVVYKVSNSLAMANSALNPLIYAWKNKEFKTSFCNIINCKSINAGSSEDELSELRIRRSKNSEVRNSNLLNLNYLKNDKFDTISAMDL